MTSATLAVLVLLAVGTIAGFVLYRLLPLRPPTEEALNESIVAQQWAGGLDHPPTHGGIDGG
jgi:hypothetical protein